MRRRIAALPVLAAGILALAGCGGGPSTNATATAQGSAGGAPITAATSAPSGGTPAGLTCADIGGVFVAHGTDGRGDCEPADPSSKCHDLSRVGTDGNYVDAMTMTPPRADGIIDQPFLLTMGISDPDCWKIPQQ